MSAINPGTDPVLDATEEAAPAVLAAFVTAVTERGGVLAGDPVRAPELDVIVLRGDTEPSADGRYGWTLTGANGTSVPVRIPGAPLAAVKALGATAPVLYVHGHANWWSDAVARAAGDLTAPDPA